jgi:hypothetical protein
VGQAAQVYLYGSALVAMADVTAAVIRQQRTQINTLFNARDPITPATAPNLRNPNTDTLQTLAVLDLSAGPLVLSLPAMSRYYSMQLMVGGQAGRRLAAGRAAHVRATGASRSGCWGLLSSGSGAVDGCVHSSERRLWLPEEPTNQAAGQAMVSDPLPPPSGTPAPCLQDMYTNKVGRFGSLTTSTQAVEVLIRGPGDARRPVPAAFQVRLNGGGRGGVLRLCWRQRSGSGGAIRSRCRGCCTLFLVVPGQACLPGCAAAAHAGTNSTTASMSTSCHGLAPCRCRHPSLAQARRASSPPPQTACGCRAGRSLQVLHTLGTCS